MASEVRVNQIQNRSGLGTVTFSDSGVSIAGVTTVGILSATGNSVFSGSVTATTFSGALTGNATGLSGTPNITVGTVTGNLTGNVNANSLVVSGVSTVAAGSTAAPSISPAGDSDTGIFFPSADTIAFGEGGSEAARIDSSGNVGIGTNNPQTKLDVNGTARANRFTVPYGTVLTTYKTNNPSTNVAIEGSPGDRDFWIFRDPVDTGSNWGIYHRNIDSSLSESGEYTVPGNSVSFVGGGTNSPGVTIDLAYGDLQVKRNIKIGNNNIIQWVEVTPGVTEWSFTGSRTSDAYTLNPSDIPSTARYVLADVFVTANSSDHQNFVLGRNTLTNQQNWVNSRGNQPSTNFGTLTRQAITLGYNGETDGYSPFFGVWYSSQHIPTSGRTIYFNNFGNSGSNGWIYVLVKAYSL